MAKSIPFTPPKRDPRETLYHKIENAPKEHAEALLDAYEILQLLRDKGILEIVKGLLGRGEKVLELATTTMETQEAVSLFRNITVLTKILGGLNPEILEKVMQVLSESAEAAKSKEPPGLLGLLGRLSKRGSRRFLASAAAVMETVGQNLGKAKEPGLRGEMRKQVTRRSVELVPNDPRAP